MKNTVDTKQITRDHIIEALYDHPCISAKEIAFFIKQKHGGDLLRYQTISGMLRPMVAQGTVGKSNTTGKTVYWCIGSMKEVQVRR